MILYFSATGNSRHVALAIAAARHDVALSMEEAASPYTARLDLSGHREWGFVFPSYFGGLPAYVLQYLHRMEVLCRPDEQPFTYCVATYGSVVGNPAAQLRRELKACGLSLHAAYAVRMVDVYTPLFDVTNEAANLRREQEAELQIAEIVKAIDQRRTHRVGPLSALIAHCEYGFYRRARRTSAFRLEAARCTGCGLCARHCPEHAIEPDAEGHPVWTKPQCSLCLRCLHHCPAFAIDRGPTSRRHGRYLYGRRAAASEAEE